MRGLHRRICIFANVICRFQPAEGKGVVRHLHFSDHSMMISIEFSQFWMRIYILIFLAEQKKSWPKEWNLPRRDKIVMWDHEFAYTINEIIRKLKQPRRRWQQDKKSCNFARFARAFSILIKFSTSASFPRPFLQLCGRCEHMMTNVLFCILTAEARVTI